MNPRLIEASYVSEYRIRLAYDDGTEGVVNLERELWGEVFEGLRDLSVFRSFRFDAELQTIAWPNGADLAPEFLYQMVAGRTSASG